MDNTPITGLEELAAHLQHLVVEPDTPLNAKLFDEVELQLNGKSSLGTSPGNYLVNTICPPLNFY